MLSSKGSKFPMVISLSTYQLGFLGKRNICFSRKHFQCQQSKNSNLLSVASQISEVWLIFYCACSMEIILDEIPLCSAEA